MKKIPRSHNWFMLAGSILLTQAMGTLGSLATIPAIPTWYASLNKPIFNPPSWLFGPVWTLLYILMGLSAYLVWKEHGWGKQTKTFFRYYFTQLALNPIWSLVFFGAKSPLLGLFVIIFLWWLILQTIRTARPLNRSAAYLLYPYLAWVSFASLLNFAIFVLN